MVDDQFVIRVASKCASFGFHTVHTRISLNAVLYVYFIRYYARI